jgi:hypothetical protein
VFMLGGFHKYRYPSLYEILLQWTFIRNYLWKQRSTCKAWDCLGEADITTCVSHHPSLCQHALFWSYRISCGPDAYILSKNNCYLCPSWLPNRRKWFWEVFVNQGK